MEEDVKRFIYNHGFAGRGDYYSYHISLGFYYAYTRDAYQLSEKVQDGEVFDDYEACTVIRNMELAKRAYRYFRNKLFPNLAVFDTAETVTFYGSKLENGRLTGDVTEAVKTAKKWLKQFYHKNNSFEKMSRIIEGGDKMTSGTLFLYEVSAYILYLCDETIDYRFLEAGHLSERGTGNEN